MRVQPIAVTGMGAITALGDGICALWSGLLSGLRPFGPVRSFDAATCRVNLAAEVIIDVPSRGSCRTVDLAVMAAKEALAAANPTVTAEQLGLVVASTGMGDWTLEAALAAPQGRAGWWTGCLKGVLTDEIAAIIGVGPVRQVVNTACSSGTIAIALACEGLRAGEFDAVLVVGCDELARTTYSGFNALRALDPEPCRPFDRNRRGMTIGEGAGCLILERAADALSQSRRIYATVAGAGWTCDSHHLTAPDPEGRGAAMAIADALEQADILPQDVGFVNAHGTGTLLNDSAEVAGIERAFGRHAIHCPVHSVKSSTGHCMGAAGTIEAIVTILSLNAGVVPATAGLVDCDFEGRLDFVQNSPRRTDARFGISNSFGFGGNNAAIVLAGSDAPVC